jgi:putative hydrolase of the HAD superfamily
MRTTKKITTLFLDIGGVLLTNGWEHESRLLAAKKFSLDEAEMEARHQLTFNTYELGKLSFEEYLDRTVFYRKRPFTKNQFREFMFAQSRAFPEMIKLITELKNKYSLKVAVVNNEASELNAYRIEKFKLKNFVDFFISSCFVHFRKPDADIFSIALDIAQVEPAEVIYIEDRPMFVSIAESLGIKGIHHVDYKKTRGKLERWGLKI